jgi:hypothetical protein
MLEIEKRNTFGQTRAGKWHVPSWMRSFAALGSLVHAAREADREKVAAPPRRRPARPVDPEEALPAAASCNNRLSRRSPFATPAANLQPNLASRLKFRSGPAVAGGRPALLERPRPRKADQPSAPPASSRGPFLQGAEAGPSSEREACSPLSAPARSAP